MKKLKLFLADDHAMFREGLRYIISACSNYDIVGESGDGRDALDRIEKLKPDVAVIDISMPGMTGIEITRRLHKYHPEIKVIILSAHDNEEYVNQLIRLGIKGYVLKDNAGEDLLKAIDEIVKDNVYLSPKITKSILAGLVNGNSRRDAGSDVLLSSREMEILKLIAEGRTNVQISSLLFISDKTVKVHRSNIMKKLNIHKATDLVKYAIKLGLVE